MCIEVIALIFLLIVLDKRRVRYVEL